MKLLICPKKRDGECDADEDTCPHAVDHEKGKFCRASGMFDCPDCVLSDTQRVGVNHA